MQFCCENIYNSYRYAYRLIRFFGFVSVIYTLDNDCVRKVVPITDTEKKQKKKNQKKKWEKKRFYGPVAIIEKNKNNTNARNKNRRGKNTR